MKFLHTSDLHIGLRLCEYSMIADVRHILGEIADIAVREQCGAVIVAASVTVVVVIKKKKTHSKRRHFWKAGGMNRKCIVSLLK